MYIKKILGAFERDVQIEAYLNDILLDYGTVGEFMDSGLTTYATVNEEYPLAIMNDKILIYLE